MITVSQAFERSSLSVPELAEALGISTSWVYDLLEMEAEVQQTLSLRQAMKLGSLLQMPLWDTEPVPTEPPKCHLSFHDLAEAIQQHSEKFGITANQFGDMVGWEVRPFLAAPETAVEAWNLDCLMDVCGALKLHWPDFIPNIESTEATTS